MSGWTKAARWRSTRPCDGDRPEPGRVYVAGTDDHLTVTPEGKLRYSRDPAENPFRPSVDVLFQSLARHWPRPGVAALLTGIGRDALLIHHPRAVDYLELGGGQLIVAAAPPPGMVGKTAGEIALAERFGVTLLAIKEAGQEGPPDC